MKPLRVFIGYDSRQPVAYNTAQFSIARNSSRPVAVTPLILAQLPIKRTGLTEFTLSRYLVPWLCNFEGHALFVDGDVLCIGDIAELPWDTDHSVSVVPHDSVRKLGQAVDMRFERPSVMLFNCAKCTALTPEFVETAKPQNLQWASSVGELPRAWNYLVGYDNGGGAKLAHFTQGLPIFAETKDDEYAAEYQREMELAGSTCSWQAIMGRSVHARWKIKQQSPLLPFMKAQGFG